MPYIDLLLFSLCVLLFDVLALIWSFQMFNIDGDCLCQLPLPQSITRPSDIHITPDGLLYVSNLLDHSVSVFRIK